MTSTFHVRPLIYSSSVLPILWFYHTYTGENGKKVVKSGPITDPDRLFNDLSEHIGENYDKIGHELGLSYKVLQNEVETIIKLPRRKAMKMLHLWKDSANKEKFTYAVLAAALEKKELNHCAEEHCYTTSIS